MSKLHHYAYCNFRIICVFMCCSATSVRHCIYLSKTTVSIASVPGMTWYSLFIYYTLCFYALNDMLMDKFGTS